MKFYHLSLALPSLILAGCASVDTNAGVPHVTYYSDPPGAILYDEKGRHWGNTPQTLYFKGLKEHFDKGYCVNPLPTMVRWASGAEASTEAQLCPPGYSKQHTFVRPIDTPGRELDVQVAIEFQRTSQQSASKNDSSEDGAAALLLLQTINGTISDRKPPPKKNTTCQTRKVGKTLQTNCW